MAGTIGKGYIKECLERDEEVQKLDFYLELAVESMVRETTDELCNGKHLETALKKSLAPNNSNNHAANAVVAGAATQAKENNNNNWD